METNIRRHKSKKVILLHWDAQCLLWSRAVQCYIKPMSHMFQKTGLRNELIYRSSPEQYSFVMRVWDWATGLCVRWIDALTLKMLWGHKVYAMTPYTTDINTNESIEVSYRQWCNCNELNNWHKYRVYIRVNSVFPVWKPLQPIGGLPDFK